LERGARRWPNADYRAGFRAVLGVDTDNALGFFRTYRAADEVMDEGGAVSAQVSDVPRSVRLVVPPGTAVLLVPGVRLGSHLITWLRPAGFEPATRGLEVRRSRRGISRK
jgi:hypothetical protein